LAIAVLSFVAGLVIALLILVMIGRAPQNWPGGLWSSWFQRTARTDLSQPTVVDRFRNYSGWKRWSHHGQIVWERKRRTSLLEPPAAGARSIAGIDRTSRVMFRSRRGEEDPRGFPSATAGDKLDSSNPLSRQAGVGGTDRISNRKCGKKPSAIFGVQRWRMASCKKLRRTRVRRSRV
jgi:hypothetical protein